MDRVKLGEALALRSDRARRAEQLRSRIVASARFQDGETPAAGKDQRAFRQLRSELTMIPALPVAELRGRADDLARELREVDTFIQRTNWEAELLD